MSKHTPGPWAVGPWDQNESEPCQRKVGVGLNAWDGIALVFGNSEEEAEANASLTAAAPMMLEALRDIANYTPEKYPDPTTALQILKENAAIARAVIATVTGDGR